MKRSGLSIGLINPPTKEPLGNWLGMIIPDAWQASS